MNDKDGYRRGRFGGTQGRSPERFDDRYDDGYYDERDDYERTYRGRRSGGLGRSYGRPPTGGGRRDRFGATGRFDRGDDDYHDDEYERDYDYDYRRRTGRSLASAGRGRPGTDYGGGRGGADRRDDEELQKRGRPTRKDGKKINQFRHVCQQLQLIGAPLPRVAGEARRYVGGQRRRLDEVCDVIGLQLRPPPYRSKAAKIM